MGERNVDNRADEARGQEKEAGKGGHGRTKVGRVRR